MMATYQKCYICEQDGYHESVEECLRAALARVKAAEVEVERLKGQVAGAEAERDEWYEVAETTETELGQFMDDLIAVVGEQVIVGDEVKFSAVVAAVAALRAQLDAAAWRPVTEPPGEDGDNYVVTVRAKWRVNYFLGLDHGHQGAFIAHGGCVLGGEVIEWRPAPPASK